MPVRYHEGKFPPKTIDWQRIAKPMERATMALARYDSFLGIIPDSSIMLSPMLVQEAVTSSRIEGTHATVSDVFLYEAGGSIDEQKSDDVLEVVNYRVALEMAEEMLKTVPLSGRLLRAAHEVLLHNVRGSLKSPGRFRTDQNWIGISNDISEARYIPIPAERLPDAMARWEEFVNSSDVPSLVKVAVAHAEFESIHPFCDGNGRVGRMIVPLMLYSDGVINSPCLYLSEFFEHRNNDYQDRLLAVSRDDDWTGWCEFFLGAIETQAAENLAKAKNIFDLYQETLKIVSRRCKAEESDAAVACMFRSAVFRSNVFVKSAGMSESSAKRLVGFLKTEKIVVEIDPHRGSRPALLAFPKLLEITEGLKLPSQSQANDK